MSDEKAKEKYLSLSGDLDELRYGGSATDKSIAGLKLIGKSLFNATKFTFSEAVPAVISAQQKAIDKSQK